MLAFYYPGAVLANNYGQPVEPSKLKPPKTISRGDTGTLVKTAQAALNEQGAHLEVNGDFGSLTEAAVKAFQRQHKLDDDGIVGPLTWAVLF